jgi:hypothetical protein
MMFILIGAVLWVVMGTAVFRRTGYAALSRAEEINSARRAVRDKASPQHSELCNKNPRWPALAASPNYKCECILSEDEEPILPWIFIWSTLFWPIVVSVWGFENALRLHKRIRGEDYNFFIPAAKVKTHKELLAESEAARKKLEEDIKELEKVNDIKVDK